MKRIFIIACIGLIALQQTNGQQIPAAKLKKGNGDNIGDTFNVKKGKNVNIQVVFDKESEAKAAVSKYKVINTGNKDPIDATQNGANLEFELKNPFEGIDKDIILDIVFIKDVKKPRQSEVHYKIMLSPGADESDEGEGEGKEEENTVSIDLLALAKELGFTLALNDLYITGGDCCTEDSYPCSKSVGCGSKEKASEKSENNYNNNLRNTVVYNAFTNNTCFFDNTGKPVSLTDKKRKYFIIQAGMPITFEIINVNPAAYKVEISDTAESFFQIPDALLAKLLVPGVVEGAALGEEEKAAEDRKNRIRAGVALLIENLKDFLLNLQHSCDHLHFDLIARKVEAKKRVDKFLIDELEKDNAVSFIQFIISELDVDGVDEELYKAARSLYSQLPGMSYRMGYYKASVPYNKDKLIFRYNIIARENTPYLDKARKEELALYIVGNFKVDVSTGLYFAWMRDDIFTLRADSFVTKTNGGEDTVLHRTRLVDEQLNRGEFGFSSFLHFYKKISPSFNWGGHIGVGVGLQNQVRARYFTGLSFIVGRESGRITANLGYAFGNVDRISNQYAKDGEGYKLLPSGEPEVKYRQKFIGRPFFSISYNLPFSLGKRTQEIKPTEDEK